jgi:hypothetical protein
MEDIKDNRNTPNFKLIIIIALVVICLVLLILFQSRLGLIIFLSIVSFGLLVACIWLGFKNLKLRKENVSLLKELNREQEEKKINVLN